MLLVEDDDVVRVLMQTILKGHGYEVVASGRPVEALAIAADAAEPFDLLVTDLSLPGLNGRELAVRLRQTQPDLRVLFMSGYTDDVKLAGGVSTPGNGFLQKPFSTEELVQALHDLFAGG